MISLKQLDSMLKNIFNEANVQSFEQVYELPESEDFYKLVFSLHNLDIDVDEEYNTTIAHTKFIFRTNIEKTELITNTFFYLKDINCVYEMIKFDDVQDLMMKIQRLINEDSFGENIKMISDFISSAPSSSINSFLSNSKVDDFSVSNIRYNPKFKITPCHKLTFNFDLELNNGENNIELTIKKNEEDFSFYYYLPNDIVEYNTKDISQMPQLIGDHLIFLYPKL